MFPGPVSTHIPVRRTQGSSEAQRTAGLWQESQSGPGRLVLSSGGRAQEDDGC